MKKKNTRLTAFSLIVAIIFIILSLRLAYIQILNGDYYKNTAEAKGEKQILELAPRGEILDRNGKKLATDLQSFNIVYSNISSKLDNNVINNELIETIGIIEKNGDDDKLNTQALRITVNQNKYEFSFPTKSEELKVQLANNFVKHYSLNLPKLAYVNDPKKSQAVNLSENEKNLSIRARDVFCTLAGKFGLTVSSQNAKNSKGSAKDGSKKIDYNLRKDISMVMIQKIIALRLAITDIGYSQYRTVYIANDVKRETAVSMLYKVNDLAGISCEVSPMRYYPNGQIGSAFLGYLGKIDESEADKFSSLGYDVSRELVGKMGLEKVLENNNEMNVHLRGEPGFKYVNVDKFGRILKQTATLDPIPGDTVVSTINLDLQKVAEQALDDTMKNISTGKTKSDALYRNATRGAAVVVDVRNGEILALASRPGFDPNWFSATGSISTEISKLVFPTDVDDPYDLVPKRMFNYATMGAGPPGSTFKPFVSIAALQESATTKLTPSTIIIDKGKYSVVPGFDGACWIWNEHKGTHGPVNLAKALEVSCNYFFFDVGRRLGYQKFEEWAWKFGLASNPKTGEKPSTGIEIDEKPGEVSSPDRFKFTNINQTMLDQVVDYLKDYKYGGYQITKGTEEYNTIKSMFMDGVYDENKLESIGIVNPKALRHLKIQINQFNSQANSIGQLLNASIGQGTTLLTPLQMVSYISTLVNGGNRYALHLVEKVLNPNGTLKKETQPEIISKIDLDPQNVDAVKKGMEKVTEDGGTASSTFRNFTIPTGGKTGSASVSPGQERHGRAAYGWYVGFAPLDKPEIAVAVVIYDAGHGGSVAPVAKAIYSEYFHLNKNKDKTAVTNQAIQYNNSVD